jgi:hypothetical protein
MGRVTTALRLTSCLFAALLLATACSGDADDDVDAVGAPALGATTTTELPLLRGSGATATTAPPATQAPGDPATTSTTSDTTAAPPPADVDTCAALASLVTVADDDVLAAVSASADPSSLELADVLRVLGDQEATPAARAAAAGRLDELAGTGCGLQGPDAVTLQPDGLDVAAFGQDRGLAAAAVSIVMGPAIIDTGPIDPVSAYGTCPGTQLWAMEWPFLVLLFNDDGDGPESFELFAWRSFDVGEDATGGIPATAEGVAVGSPFAGIVDLYATRGAVEQRDELLDVDVVEVPDAYLILDDGTGSVATIEGGAPCGE